MRTLYEVQKHPLDATSFIVNPLETHPFVIDQKDDYRCAICHRPRALHASPGDYIAHRGNVHQPRKP
jgi:ureidoglycolate hydrolase